MRFNSLPLSLGLLFIAGTLRSQEDFSVTMPDSFSFCGERVPIEQEDVRERLEDAFYSRTGKDDRMLLLMKRTKRYFPFFERILKEMDAPDDLKFLAAAESGLRIEAYSRADAGGLWQFIPSTARLWGLTVTATVDERFHIEKSTRASITMLKSLKEAFGSWSLAAAAYNNGQANINKLLKEQKQTNYFEAFMNKETRNYVFQIVVLKEILMHPEKYDLKLSEKEFYQAFDHDTKRVAIKGPVADLGTWAIQQGTTYKNVKLLNFWIMKNSLPDGPWELLLPISAQPVAVASDSIIVARADSVIPVKTDSSLVMILHTVREGDALIKIAKQYAVSASEIMHWNELKSDNIVVGSKLKIYIPSSKKITYTVQTGDNLLKIADQYKVSVDQLIKWNNLPNDAAILGANLVIYVGMSP